MPQVVSQNGVRLNSDYKLGEIQGICGLILESWVPSDRNADYNRALDTLIERLAIYGLEEISVNVISRDLMSKFPVFSDRSLKVRDSTAISISTVDIKDQRLRIGRLQAEMKVDPDVRGGNRTKRILLYNHAIDATSWERIAEGFSPDSKQDRIDRRVEYGDALPTGNVSPTRTRHSTVTVDRDPFVRSWILHNASGVCELCGFTAPFFNDAGLPFLEVHHVFPLAAGGPDTVDNAVALCPNCHRELHHGVDRTAKTADLIRLIGRLDSIHS